MKYNRISKKEFGSVSLFVVIFATLLITVVTLSFIRIMMQNQQQATASDLSQSAYDSAQAGVEDAKRAILRYQTTCRDGDAACREAQKLIDSSLIGSTLGCNDAVTTLSGLSMDIGTGEVATGQSGDKLNQAYTCVKINLDTNDYLGTLRKNTSKFIPLVGVGDSDYVRVEWYDSSDLGSSTKAILPEGDPSMLSQSSWGMNRPAIMRVQLVQFPATAVGFTLDGIDINKKIFNSSLFLYPYNIIDTGAPIVMIDGENSRQPKKVHCEDDFSSTTYLCSATIKLPKTLVAGDKTTFLNLMPLYNDASYSVKLLNSIGATSTVIKFSAVQPEIDSTGRADNLFRRIQTRVELTDVNFPYPEAVVDVEGNVCKTITVTDVVEGYSTGDCTP